MDRFRKAVQTPKLPEYFEYKRLFDLPYITRHFFLHPVN